MKYPQAGGPATAGTEYWLSQDELVVAPPGGTGNFPNTTPRGLRAGFYNGGLRGRAPLPRPPLLELLHLGLRGANHSLGEVGNQPLRIVIVVGGKNPVMPPP